jgi:anti-sigma factor RsiW
VVLRDREIEGAMKAETQHLDYLISQYVDGCLDPASKKSVEQQLLCNPTAKQLYKDHRDTQELLDDWGNRIPMIDWADFDKTLAMRLEKEVVGARPVSIFRRWTRPLAAAAALLMAAWLGYMWHGSSVPVPVTREVVAAAPVTPHKAFAIVENISASGPYSSSVVVVEPAVASAHQVDEVATIAQPVDSQAVQSLKEAVSYGLRNVDQLDVQQNGGTYAIEVTVPKKEKDPPQ